MNYPLLFQLSLLLLIASPALRQFGDMVFLLLWAALTLTSLFFALKISKEERKLAWFMLCFFALFPLVIAFYSTLGLTWFAGIITSIILLAILITATRLLSPNTISCEVVSYSDNWAIVKVDKMLAAPVKPGMHPVRSRNVKAGDKVSVIIKKGIFSNSLERVL